MTTPLPRTPDEQLDCAELEHQLSAMEVQLLLQVAMGTGRGPNGTTSADQVVDWWLKGGGSEWRKVMARAPARAALPFLPHGLIQDLAYQTRLQAIGLLVLCRQDIPSTEYYFALTPDGHQMARWLLSSLEQTLGIALPGIRQV